jgi:polyphosphate kinase
VRSGLIERIEKETALGTSGCIRIKVNSLVDEAVIDALYRASQAGVSVDLLTRGICALRPEVPGLSENIRVRSILGRFLEHSRVFWWFGNEGSPEVWIGSADLMHRNLDRRVEVLVALPSPALIEEVGRVLDVAFADHTAAWHLGSDGVWTRHSDEDGRPLQDLQAWLVAHSKSRRRLP